MRVAFDVNYSDTVMGSLARRGFEIVTVARRSEHDDDWLLRAVQSGAEVIVSHDLDVPNWLDRYGFTDVLHVQTREELILLKNKSR